MPADDAQRDLERHALSRVHSLAAKLGLADAIDARSEKTAIRWFAGAVIVVIIGLAASALFKESDEEKQLEVKRCRVAVRVAEIDNVRREFSIPRLVEQRINELQDQRCPAKG